MPHYVVDACVKCKYTDCVSVCPVDCFYEGPNMLVINPDECIDCGVCIPECPVDAIIDDYQMKDYPDKDWIKINHEMSEQWPNITDQKDPLPEAEEFKDTKDKKSLMEK